MSIFVAPRLTWPPQELCSGQDMSLVRNSHPNLGLAERPLAAHLRPSRRRARMPAERRKLTSYVKTSLSARTGSGDHDAVP